MRNRFPGLCRDCGEPVAAAAGYFEKQPCGSASKWAVRCMRCVVGGKLRAGHTVSGLSWAQKDWWRDLPKEEQSAIANPTKSAAQTRPNPKDPDHVL